jgi:hypothetical protein
MARKPKTQPSLEAPAPVSVPPSAKPNEAAVPARRGRKPKAAALSFASPLASVGNPATDGAEADVLRAGPTKAPGRRGPGRKPKQAAGVETAPSMQDDAAGPQSQASRQPEAEASPGLIEADTPLAAVVSQAAATTDSDLVQPDSKAGRSASKAAQPSTATNVPVPAKPAAHWDRTTDTMQFDWPAIERAAAQDGPNRGMAKLLVAARAEGAHSRWPL